MVVAWSRSRSVGSSAAVPALWACTSRSWSRRTSCPSRRITRRFPQTINRNVDLLFLIDDSSSMAASRRTTCCGTSRASCSALENLPGGLPNVHIAVISSDMGAGDGIDRELRRDWRQERNLPVRRRAARARPRPGSRRDVHLERRRRDELHRQPRRRVHVHRRARRVRLRVRAPVRGDHARAGRRRRAARRPRTRASCAATRYLAIVMITNEDDCSAAGRRAAVRHRPDGSLMSQLGPPRTSAATSSVTSATARRRRRHAPNGAREPTRSATRTACRPRERRLLTTVADTRGPDQGAQARSRQPDPASPRSPGPTTPYQVHWKTRRRGDDTGAVARDLALVHGRGRQLRRPVRARRRARFSQFGDGRPPATICDDDFAPALRHHRAEDRGRPQAAVHRGPGSRIRPAPASHRLHRRQRARGDGTLGPSTSPSASAPTSAGATPCWRSCPGPLGAVHRQTTADRRRSDAPPAPARTPRSPARCASQASPRPNAAVRSPPSQLAAWLPPTWLADAAHNPRDSRGKCLARGLRTSMNVAQTAHSPGDCGRSAGLPIIAQLFARAHAACPHT